MQADAVAWVHRQYGEEIQFLGVSRYDDLDVVRSDIEKLRMDFPHIIDDGPDVFAHFAVTSHPTTIYVAADGGQERSPGNQSPEAILAGVEALLGSPA